MKKIDFNKAYFIKLGKKGIWNEDSIKNNIIRIGWQHVPTSLMNQKDTKQIRQIIDSYSKNKASATADYNSLMDVIQADKNVLFITFYKSSLWWAKSSDQTIYEDEISKYRRVEGSWKNTDIKNNPLFLSDIDGEITKIARYQGTRCLVHSKDKLYRLLNRIPSDEYIKINENIKQLSVFIVEAIKKLNWKDFEILIDLIFRQSGWIRVGISGESVEFADLELYEPVTNNRYAVQIKQQADVNVLKEYISKFNSNIFKKFYFVVGIPDKNLINYNPSNEQIEILTPKRISELIIKLGLLDFILKKIKY